MNDEIIKAENKGYDNGRKNAFNTFLLIIFFFAIIRIDLYIYSESYDKKSEENFLLQLNASKGINEDNLERIYFSNEMMEILNKRYSEETAEFAYCLNGISQEGDNSTFINEVVQGITYYRNNVSILSSCYGDIKIHSHPIPYDNCKLSKNDIKALNISHSISHSKYSCVICGENKIRCYNKNVQEAEVII